MSLLQQFILVSLLPASFLLLIVYSLRLRKVRPRVFFYWAGTLLTAAVWASSTLSYYGGISLTPTLAYTWRSIGQSALGLLPFMLLLTTLSHLRLNTKPIELTTRILFIVWLVAVLLHPGWPYTPTNINLFGANLNLPRTWPAIWVGSWLLTTVFGWLLTQRAIRSISGPLYRNQLNYWLVALSFFAIGGGMGLARELVLVQFGALTAVFAASLGAISLVRSQLPDFQMATRRVLSRILGSIIVFTIIWVVVSIYLLQNPSSRLPGSTIFPVAVLAGLITIVYSVVNFFSTRLFLSGTSKPVKLLLEDGKIVNGLLEPEVVGQYILNLVHDHLEVEDAWMMMAETGPKGSTIFRPLANQKEVILMTATFEAGSPFVEHLRENSLPLTQHDIDTHSHFEILNEQERQIIHRWQRMAFVPLKNGRHLTGLLAVGRKVFDQPYNRHDFETLESIAVQVSPILAQARQVDNLHQLNRHVFKEKQALSRDKHYLWELIALNNKFLDFVSPELRNPLAKIEEELRTLEHNASYDEDKEKLGTLAENTAEVKGFINSLIHAVSRVEKQNNFSYELLHMDEIIRQAIQNLSSMAKARRVQVDLALIGNIQPAYGDRVKLVEAVQHLLHNAIKFNKIGGQVRIECSSNGLEVAIDVIDNGVGIPEERLETIWDGLPKPNVKSVSNGRQLGMGLVMTRFIVQAHGGRVGLNSKHGAGSTFTIYLPTALEAH
jgi:signal transduction histidine kinase